MKILEVNKFFHIRGGADKNFLDAIDLFKRRENDVAVFAMQHADNLQSPWSKYFVSNVDYNEGTLWNRLKGALRIFWSFEAKRKIGMLLDDFSPEVVHVHNIYHQISPSILPEIKKRGIPVIMTVHDWKLICPNYLLNCEKPYCTKCVSGKYMHCVWGRCVKNSFFKSLLCVLEMYFHRSLSVYDKNVDLYIAPSQFVKKMLIAAGFKEEKIKVIPHFMAEDEGEEKKSMPLEDLQEPYALYTGRISKEKGADELIEIFRKIPQTLVLAGTESGDVEIPDLPNIKHVGFKSRHEISDLIRNSLFVVSASRLPETFGLIALEAQRKGKYFVGYDTGAYSEIVQIGENGWLVNSREELANRIKQIFSAPPENSFASADGFSEASYYQEFSRVFEGLSAGKQKSGKI